MMDSRESCPAGWDPAELLSYLEGELGPYDVRRLEDHLRTCIFCFKELESLRKVDLLLKRYPDSFHPEEEALYQYASTGGDSPKNIESHILSCPSCKEEVEVLREIIRLGGSGPAFKTTLPPALAQEFERIHGPVRATKAEGLWASWWRKLWDLPKSLPILTLGTAAAALVIAILSVPLWETFKTVPPPGARNEPAISGEKPDESLSRARHTEPAMEKASPAAAGEARNQRSDRQRSVDTDKKTREIERVIVDEYSIDDRPKPSALPGLALQSRKEKQYPAAGLAPEQKRKREFAFPTPLPKEQNDSEGPARLEDATGRMKESDGQRIEKQTSNAGSLSGRGSNVTGKIPVEVIIIDALGRDLESALFVPPADERYSYFRGRSASGPDKAAPELSEERQDGHIIIIKVEGEGVLYRLRGRMFSRDSNAAEKTVSVEGVTEENLGQQIQALVSALVKDN